MATRAQDKGAHCGRERGCCIPTRVGIPVHGKMPSLLEEGAKSPSLGRGGVRGDDAIANRIVVGVRMANVRIEGQDGPDGRPHLG